MCYTYRTYKLHNVRRRASTLSVAVLTQRRAVRAGGGSCAQQQRRAGAEATASKCPMQPVLGVGVHRLQAGVAAEAIVGCQSTQIKTLLLGGALAPWGDDECEFGALAGARRERHDGERLVWQEDFERDRPRGEQR